MEVLKLCVVAIRLLDQKSLFGPTCPVVGSDCGILSQVQDMYSCTFQGSQFGVGVFS